MGALLENLSYTDVIGIGIAAILGSGGFSLIGKAVNRGGSMAPLALGVTALLFMGASKVYAKAFESFPSNTAESEIVEEQFGKATSRVAEGGILLFNILSISTILIFCGKFLFPKGTWIGQISVAMMFLVLMYVLTLHGIHENKQVMNLFSGTVLVVLTLISGAGIVEGMRDGVHFPPAKTTNFPLSILYFYFILAGFDSIMKFTEEAKIKSDIPKAFYMSNILSILLVTGVALAYLHLGTQKNEENAIGEIVKGLLGGKNTSGIVMGGSIIFMLVATFVCFLASSRFLYGLGEKSDWKWMTSVNEVKAPTNAILTTFLIAAVAILINHVDYLVRACDVFLTITLVLVSAAVTKKEIDKGKFPVIEGATLTGLVALFIMTVSPSVRTE
jgi:amino acid transporter